MKMGEKDQLKKIIDKTLQSHKQLDRGANFESYCELKLKTLATHADRAGLLQILLLFYDRHNKMPHLTVVEIAEKTRMNIDTVRRYVDRLVEEKMIDRISPEPVTSHKQPGRPRLYSYILNRDFFEAWGDQAPHRLRSETTCSFSLELRKSDDEDERRLLDDGICRCPSCGNLTRISDLRPRSGGELVCRQCAEKR